MGDDGHHDNPGCDILDVTETTHLAYPRSDQIAEDHEIQGHGDGRRQDRLDPDPGKAAHLLYHNGLESNIVKLRSHTPLTPVTLTRFPLSCSKRINNSSKRLALLRMLTTSIPRSDRHRNKALRPRSLLTSTSRVVSSTRLNR